MFDQRLFDFNGGNGLTYEVGDKLIAKLDVVGIFSVFQP